MLVKTLLNRIEKYKCFVYDKIRFAEVEGSLVIEVDIRPRENSHARCSRCGAACPGYDTLDLRRFESVPLWGIPVFFMYCCRRVE